MARNIVRIGHMTAGYLVCMGNHIPWNVTPQWDKIIFGHFGRVGVQVKSHGG